MGPISYLYREVTESTMDDARNAVKSGCPSGTVCYAGRQSRGRGRMPGRLWEDDGRSLLFTLILRRDEVTAPYPLTQSLALALSRRLEIGYGLSPEIKWPNDVLVDSAKIAGILVETEGAYYLAGMGINLSQRRFPPGLRTPATSLMLQCGTRPGQWSPPAPAEELTFLLDDIRGVLDEVPDIDEITRRLAGRGQQISLLLGDPSRQERLVGILQGLREDGSLAVRLPDGRLETVYSGEIIPSSPSEPGDEEKS